MNLQEKIKDDKYYFLLKQEGMYWNSQQLLYYGWYRRIYGGDWTLLKLGKDTPNIRLFAIWTKLPDCFSGYKVLVDQYSYPETGVDTNWKFYKQFFKNMWRKSPKNIK